MTKKYVDISPELVKNLSTRSDLWGAWLTFHVWVTIFLAWFLFVQFPNPFTFIFAFLIIGTRQHGLSVLMHEAAHGILFKNRPINDWVGQWLLAAPYGGDLKAYRKYHLVHHRHTQTELDPDLPLSAKFPVTKQSLRRKFLRDLSGLTFLRIQIATYKIRRGKKIEMEGTDAFEATSALPALIMNLIIFGAVSWAGFWWTYPFLWLLPYVTVFWAVIRVRNIAEHALTARNDNPLEHARTTKTNLLTRALIAPYWVNYHVEHHAYMYVPCFNLPKLHEVLLESGYEEKMDLKQGYSDVLSLATGKK